MSFQNLATTWETYDEAGPSTSIGSSVPASQSSSGDLAREGFLALSAMLDSPELRSQLHRDSGRAVQEMAKRGGPNPEQPLDPILALNTMDAFMLSLDLLSGETSTPSRGQLSSTRAAYTNHLAGEFPGMMESAKHDPLLVNRNGRAVWSTRLEAGRKSLVDLYPRNNHMINNQIMYLRSDSKEETLNITALKTLQDYGRLLAVPTLLPWLTKVNLILTTSSSLWDLADYELVAAACQAVSKHVREGPAATPGSAYPGARTASDPTSIGIAKKLKSSSKTTSTNASDWRVDRKLESRRKLVARKVNNKHKDNDPVTEVKPSMSSILAGLADQLSERISVLRHTPNTDQYTSQQVAVSHTSETTTLGYSCGHSAPDLILSSQQTFLPTAMPTPGYWSSPSQVPANHASTIDWAAESNDQPDQELGEDPIGVATQSHPNWAESCHWSLLQGVQSESRPSAGSEEDEGPYPLGPLLQ